MENFPALGRTKNLETPTFGFSHIGVGDTFVTSKHVTSRGPGL